MLFFCYACNVQGGPKSVAHCDNVRKYTPILTIFYYNEKYMTHKVKITPATSS